MLNSYETYIQAETSYTALTYLAIFIYLVGLLGMIYNYKNYLVTMMSVELMYLGAITAFVLYSSLTHSTDGAVYSLLILILAACESAIGLGLLILLYRFGRSIEFSYYEALRGLTNDNTL